MNQVKKSSNDANQKSLIIELTRECNNNCRYCYQQEKIFKIDIERLKETIIEFRKKGFTCVEFSGGEPTLSPHLPDLVRLAKKEGYTNITLLTNGRRLAYENYFNGLINLGINAFIFSVPGHTPNLYKKVTRTSEKAFLQLCRALEMAEDKKDKIEVGTVTIISKENYKYLHQITQWLANRKFDFITLGYPIPFEIKTKGEFFVAYEKIYPYIKKSLGQARSKAKICIDGVPFCQAPGCEDFILNEVFMRDSIVVDPTGRISSRLETIKLLSVRLTKCLDCINKRKCAGFFIDHLKNYNLSSDEKIIDEHKAAFDIQNGACDYDYIFCSRRIGGKRYSKLADDKVNIDYQKLALFCHLSSRVTNQLDIWGRERVDEFEEIEKVLKIAKKYFRKITLWSSGLKLADPEKIRYFAKKGVTKFEIPIYGSNSAIHDAIVKKKGSFEKIISTISTLEKTKSKFSLHTVVLKQNCGDLLRLIKLASRLKPTSFSIWFYYPDEGADRVGISLYKEHCPSYSDVISCIDHAEKKGLDSINLEFVFFPKCVFSKIKRVIKGAKLIRPGLSRFMVANKRAILYKYIDGRREFGVIYSRKCDLCREKQNCNGVFKEYLDIYGDAELNPIR